LSAAGLPAAETFLTTRLGLVDGMPFVVATVIDFFRGEPLDLLSGLSPVVTGSGFARAAEDFPLPLAAVAFFAAASLAEDAWTAALSLLETLVLVGARLALAVAGPPEAEALRMAEAPGAGLDRFLGEGFEASDLVGPSVSASSVAFALLRFFPLATVVDLDTLDAVTVLVLLFKDPEEGVFRTTLAPPGGGTIRSSCAEATVSCVVATLLDPSGSMSGGACEEDSDSGAI
jgi:hypothetical protein